MRLAAQLSIDATPEFLVQTYAFEGGRFMTDIPRTSRREAENNVWGAINAADVAAKREAIRAHEMLGLNELIVRSMTQLGLHVVCTQTATPIEMEETAAGVAARFATLQAVKQGSTFIYIRPTPEMIKGFNEKWMFQRTISMDEAEREFNAFREWLIESLLTEKLQRSAAERKVDSRVAQIYVDEFPYFVPGFSVGLVHEVDDFRRTTQRISVRVPGLASFSWISQEIHVFRFVSATRKVVEQNIAPKGRKARQHWTPAVGQVCSRACRLLNEHFAFGWKDDLEVGGD